jgi:hypothetical protein
VADDSKEIDMASVDIYLSSRHHRSCIPVLPQRIRHKEEYS